MKQKDKTNQIKEIFESECEVLTIEHSTDRKIERYVVEIRTISFRDLEYIEENLKNIKLHIGMLFPHSKAENNFIRVYLRPL